MKRRKFIKTSLQAGSAFYLGLNANCRGEDQQAHSTISLKRSTLVEAKSYRIRDTYGKLISSQVEQLLNKAMTRLLETEKPESAWQKLVKKDDVVGIKINCLAGRGMSTHLELVEAIVEGLRSAGVPDRNIIIWDRANRDLEKAGYKIQTNRNKLKCYGNDQVGYSRRLYEFGEVGSFLSNIVIHQCTAIINVPILKDHGIVGMTNALKNFFGAIHNPNKYHDNCGDPYIADVNMLPDIRKKIRLIITDALTAQYEGGPPYMPQWSWQHNGLIVGFDPVALDSYGYHLIEKKRKEKKLPSLKEAGREPTYIATAADKAHQLGTDDLSKLQIIQV
ncbi:hypothetical protein B6D60_05205 [candidate division KSB1 bacterium 4484_87]|nr:MAG: hypothetical protein B6D60_05205 [candidate division KSB1 bacterium 4484_87]